MFSNLSKEQIKEMLNVGIVMSFVAGGFLACTQYSAWSVFCSVMTIGMFIELKSMDLDNKMLEFKNQNQNNKKK